MSLTLNTAGRPEDLRGGDTPARTSPPFLIGKHSPVLPRLVGSLNGGAYQTLIEHWDGTSWTVVPSPNTSESASNLEQTGR